MEVDTTRAITPAAGLTSAQVAERRERGQVNVTLRRTGRRTRDIIYSNVFTRINAILGVLFVIVATTGSLINGAFGLLIIANSSIGIIQELRAKRTLDRLTILGEEDPKVIRDGATAEIPRDSIVLDDLIDIGAGDQLVVDGVKLVTPITLDVIGDSHALDEGARFRGGLVSQVQAEQVGGRVMISRLDEVRIDALHAPVTPQWAKPA